MGEMMLDLMAQHTLNVDRSHQRDELLAIRNDEVPVAESIRRCEDLIAQIERNLPESGLTEICNVELINEITVSTVLQVWRSEGLL
jgi:hypothetical protein